MEGEKETSSQSCKTNTTASVGVLHVLVVDDDTTCLAIVAAVLKTWKYEVVTAKHPNDALSTLRLKKGLFDLVLTDIHMPGMNGFELQKQVEEEFKLPVIMMSADDRESVILKGLAGGSPFFIVKPVRVEELGNIWQYATAIKKGRSVDMEKPVSGQEEPSIIGKLPLDMDSGMSPINEENYESRECKRKSCNRGSSALGGDEKNEPMPKKTKVVWTNGLHNRFLEAVRKLGLEKAVPKKILELMNVQGLTRENIASHLQKYRMFLRRVSAASNSIEQDYMRTPSSQQPVANAPLLNSVCLHKQGLTDSSIPQFSNVPSQSISYRRPEMQSFQNSSQTSLLPRDQGASPMQQQRPNRSSLEHLTNAVVNFDRPFSDNYVGIRMTSSGELVRPTRLKPAVTAEASNPDVVTSAVGYGMMDRVNNGNITTPYLLQEVPSTYVGITSAGGRPTAQFGHPFALSSQLQILLQHERSIVANTGMLGLMHSACNTGSSNTYFPQPFGAGGGDIDDAFSKQISDQHPLMGAGVGELWNPVFPSSFFGEEQNARNQFQPFELQGGFGSTTHYLDQNLQNFDHHNPHQGSGGEELMNLVVGTALYGNNHGGGEN